MKANPLMSKPNHRRFRPHLHVRARMKRLAGAVAFFAAALPLAAGAQALGANPGAPAVDEAIRGKDVSRQ